MAGLFFCLASTEGAGFLFCPAAIQPHTSVYSVFCVVHELYRLDLKSVYAALQELFRLFATFCAYYPAVHPAMLYSLQGAGGHTDKRSASSTHQIPAPRRTLYRSVQLPYYNNVYKSVAYRRPYQPGGVSMLLTPGGLQSGTGQQSGRAGWHPLPGGAVQRQGRGGAARNH